jgi:type II secretory pathway pseudopilin PulG
MEESLKIIKEIINGPHGSDVLIIVAALAGVCLYLMLIGKLKRVYDKKSGKYIWTVERERQAYDRAHSTEKTLAGMQNTLNMLNDKSDEQYMAILRLQIHDEQLPLAERVDAGNVYLKRGGNGETKIYVQTLKTQLKDQVKGRMV